MTVKTATINGTRYDIDLDVNLGGYCDHPEGKGNPCIAVCSDPNTRLGLTHLIHECLHASVWSAHENTVDRTSKDIGRLLWRLGYRLQSEGDNE